MDKHDFERAELQHEIDELARADRLYADDFYGDEVICESCGGTFDESDDIVYRGMCQECAENEYTDELGLEYIGNSPADFYSKHWKIDLTGKPTLCDILHDNFVKAVTADIELGRTGAEREALKDYCVNDDIKSWIDFLCEREG